MNWLIEPTLTHNVAEIMTYTKDGISVTVAAEYNWGEAIVYSPAKPVLENSDETRFDASEVQYEVYDLDNISIIGFSEGTRRGICEDISDFIDTFGLEEFEALGWEVVKCEICLYGILQVKEL